MAIYSLSEIQQTVARNGVLLANTRARNNARQLGWTQAMLGAFVDALREDHYRGAMEAASVFDGRAELDVDQYKMRFDEENLCETRDATCCVFWMKLGLSQMPDGMIVALASFHLDGQP